MSKFTTALIVSPLADGISWVVIDDFKYHVGSKDSSDVINVSEGFVTDFMSVPRWLWWFIPRWGKYGNAAVIHDWLYWNQELKSRKQADQILLEGMGVLKVSRWKRMIIYYAVRSFGGIAWFRNAVDKENGIARVIKTASIKATKGTDRPCTMKCMLSYYIK